MDPKSRVQLLESLMADTVHELDYVQIDHVMKVPHKDRNFTPISYIEFNNNDDRERALRIFVFSGVRVVDSKSSPLRFNRLKSNKQIHCNYCFKKAKDMLENDPRAQGKSVSINWKLEINKDRNVVVDGCVCFVESPMICSAHSLMRSPTSTLSRGRAALCTWAATHNVSLFHTVIKVMPPMVRGCRLLMRFTVITCTCSSPSTSQQTRSSFSSASRFCISSRLCAATASSRSPFTPCAVSTPFASHHPSSPTTAIRRRRFSCSWAAAFPSKCSWWHPSNSSSGATCCN